MMRTLLLGCALAFALAVPASARHAEHSNHASTHTAHHHHAHNRRAPAREQGDEACSGDARRLCRSVLDQGDMAVLGCFKSQAPRLSAGCRALLHSYGQM